MLQRTAALAAAAFRRLDPPRGVGSGPLLVACSPGWQFYLRDDSPGDTLSISSALAPYRPPPVPVTHGGPAYPAYPAPAHPVPVPYPGYHSPVVVVGGYKSTPLAVVLAFFFGPLGMLYSTLTGAAIMFLVNLAALFLTFGLGLIVTWPLSALWAGLASSQHNARLAAAAVPRY